MGNQDFETAVHEAGHCAVSIDQRLPFLSVDIEQTETRYGRMRSNGIAETQPSEVLLNPFGEYEYYPTRPGVERQVMVLLGGRVAEQLVRADGPDWDGARTDDDYARTLLCELAAEPEELNRWYDYLEQRVFNFLTQPVEWAGVRGIADALVWKRSLTARQARAAFRAARQDATRVATATVEVSTFRNGRRPPSRYWDIGDLDDQELSHLIRKLPPARLRQVFERLPRGRNAQIRRSQPGWPRGRQAVAGPRRPGGKPEQQWPRESPGRPAVGDRRATGSWAVWRKGESPGGAGLRVGCSGWPAASRRASGPAVVSDRAEGHTDVSR